MKSKNFFVVFVVVLALAVLSCGAWAVQEPEYAEGEATNGRHWLSID